MESNKRATIICQHFEITMLIRHIVLLATHLFRIIGVYSEKMEGYIVDGAIASIKDFPHSVFLAIECFRKEAIDYACGGSIINQDFILTAGHCFEDCDPLKSIVIACVGAANYSQSVTARVAGVKVHEKYSSSIIQHDIGLMKLKTSLNFNRKVQRIYLMRNPPDEKIAEVAGWGLVDETKGIESVILKVAVQKLKPVKECTGILGYLPPNALCGDSVGGYAAEGDSGSALVMRRFIQIGIVSYKDPKISVGLVVYTNVSAYYDWIMINMNDMVCR